MAKTILVVLGAATAAAAQTSFDTGPFSLESPDTLAFTFELVSLGEIGGFLIWMDYLGDGGNTYANDTNTKLTAPDGQTVSIGGFGSEQDLPYGFGQVDTSYPGMYCSGPHEGWIDGGPVAGTYTLVFTQDWGVGNFASIEVGIVSVPASGSAAIPLAGLLALRRRR